MSQYEDFEVKVGDTVKSKNTGEVFTVTDTRPQGVTLRSASGEARGCMARADGERRFLMSHYWEKVPQ